jgi:hypothetical protein
MVGGAQQHRARADDDQRHERQAEPEFAADHRAPLRGRGRRLRGDHAVERGDVGVLHVHHFLELLDVDLFHVLLARGPRAGADAQRAADDLHAALQQQREARQRNDELERVQRQRLGREGLLADGERLARVDPAGPGERHDARHEEHDVQHQVDQRLRARAEEAVEHVAAHVAVLGKRVGPGGHEHGAVQHDLRVEHPGVRLVQHVAREHLPADQQREQQAHQAKVLPIQVENRSTASSKDCIATNSSPRPVARRRRAGTAQHMKRGHRHGCPRVAGGRFRPSSPAVRSSGCRPS